jgi:hypothetical protein
MDYSKLTKQELINELESIQCDTCEPCATCEPREICKTCEDCVDVKLKLKDAEYRIKSLEESNAEIRKNEYDFRADSSQKMQAQKKIYIKNQLIMQRKWVIIKIKEKICQPRK